MESIYYIRLMKKDDLCCLICGVNADEVNNSTSKSFFHFQRLKCRYLLNMMRDYVIGSPVPFSPRSIYLIMSKDFYKTAGIQMILTQSNLSASPPQPVTSSAYISCLKYTFGFVLAPQWNKITRNPVFLYGREFLTSPDNCNTAIKMNITTMSTDLSKSEEFCLKLSPIRMKLSSPTLSDFDLPQTVISDFMSDPRGSIKVDLFRAVRISVLPSLNRGNLVAIFKQIPQWCPYKNWTELRRHWKNMYGYRLPESDEGIFFYEIYFVNVGSQENEHLIYPDICVRDLQQSRYDGNVKVMTDKFVNDLKNLLPQVCTRPTEITDCRAAADSTGIQDRKMPETPLNQISLPRQLTSPMSLTPSITGVKRPDRGAIDFSRLKKIQKIHQPMTASEPTVHSTRETNFGLFIHPTGSRSALENLENDETHKQINIFSPSVKKN